MRLEPAATRSILPLLPLIAALGCHKELLAPTGPASADGLSVALRVTYAALRVGQSDSITVTLTNTKPDTVSLQSAAVRWSFTFRTRMALRSYRLAVPGYAPTSCSSCL